jgi:hypothetical protein
MAEHNDRSAATEGLTNIERVRLALAMADAGYEWDVELEYVEALLRAYDDLRAPAQRPSVMDAVILTEKLIQAAVDYENGVCGRQELSKARAAVETALAAQPPAAPAETNTNANPASRSTATATAIAGDDRESMETRPLKVVSPEAGSPPQCSAGNADVRETLLDVKSHREAWRSALLEQQTPFGSDDDGSYWAHELRVFDRTFAALGKIILNEPQEVPERDLIDFFNFHGSESILELVQLLRSTYRIIPAPPLSRPHGGRE